MVATIYAVAAEDIDLTGATGTVSWVTAAATIRSGWARVSGAGTTISTVADPPSIRLQLPTFAAQSTLWVHAQFEQSTSTAGSGAINAATTANCQMIRLIDGGTARLLVRGTGTAGQLKISTRNAAGTITDLVTGSSSAWTGAITPIDLFVNYGTSGEVTLYVGGVQVADFTGDVTTNSATTLNQVEFSTCITSGTAFNFWSEMIVADSDTRGRGLWLMNSSSAGNVDQWTGTLANVNKNTINDATFISSGTAAQIQEYILGSAPSGAYNVDAVIMAARALVGATGPQHFEFVTRLGGTDYPSADQAPTTAFANFQNYIQATNPSGSGNWALADLTAAGVNYGVKSTA